MAVNEFLTFQFPIIFNEEQTDS